MNMSSIAALHLRIKGPYFTSVSFKRIPITESSLALTVSSTKRVQEYDFFLNLNVKGLFNMPTESLKPVFLAPHASFVHIGNMFSLQGYKNGAVFAASKHAVLGMVRSAAKETGDRVRVNCVLPGVIDTPMYRAILAKVKDFTPAPTTLIPRPGSAQEVADVTVFLLSDESSFVTGAAWSVDGGANA
ncbi:hypothetical protein V1524DRAFT_49946 [Lipomyces starkeyi]